MFSYLLFKKIANQRWMMTTHGIGAAASDNSNGIEMLIF